MIKVKNIHNGIVVYFRFFASMRYPHCFWYTNNEANNAFELGHTNDYEPLNEEWKDIKDEENT